MPLDDISIQQQALEDDIHRLFSYAWFCIALVVYACTIVVQNPTDHHEHLLQAWAWLHGHAHVDGFGIHEVAAWNGHFYVLHPPLPTLLDLPITLLFGPLIPQSYISILVGALCVMLSYRLTQSRWLTIFFGFGTVFWYETTLGAAWGFCAVLSCLPTFLALIEIQKGERGNPWKLGLWAGLAALARYDMVAAWPVYLLLWNSSQGSPFLPRPGWPRILPGLFLSLAIYAIHGYAKYGVPYDMGLNLWYAVDTAGGKLNPGLGPFSLHYLPLNLYTALFMAPAFTVHFPWVIPQPMGQALIFTSPALLLLVGLTWSDRKIQLLGLAVILSMAGCLTVWSNGVEQFGARYWIQALPFLILMLASIEKREASLVRRLVLVSVGLVAWGTACIRLWGWPG